MPLTQSACGILTVAPDALAPPAAPFTLTQGGSEGHVGTVSSVVDTGRCAWVRTAS
jgi:hypothetical protein